MCLIPACCGMSLQAPTRCACRQGMAAPAAAAPIRSNAVPKLTLEKGAEGPHLHLGHQAQWVGQLEQQSFVAVLVLHKKWRPKTHNAVSQHCVHSWRERQRQRAPAGAAAADLLSTSCKERGQGWYRSKSIFMCGGSLLPSS